MKEQVKEQLITFVLTDKYPTSYQLPDGTYSDTPVRKRIFPEFDELDESGNITRCRHIRTASSIEVEKQNGLTFNNRKDNIYFSNGLCVLSSTKDARTVEFLRRHTHNADVPDFKRNPDVFPSFREVKGEESGLNEIDKLILIQNAKNIALSLRKKDGSYDSKLKFLSRAFNLDGSLESSEQVVALVAKAESNPTDFIHRVNSKWEAMEDEFDKAIKLKVVSFDEKVAFLRDQIIFSSDVPISESAMQSEIISLFLSDNDLNNRLKEALAREIELTKANKKTKSTTEPKTAQPAEAQAENEK